MVYLNTVVFIFIVFLFKNWFYKIKRKQVNGFIQPSGPFPLPIIGNIHQLGEKSPHLYLEKYKHKYNGVVRIWMFDRYCLFISNLEIIKELFNNQKEFNQRNLIPNIRIASNNGKGIAGSGNEKWLKNKSIFLKSIRRFNVNSKLVSIISDKVNDLIEIFKLLTINSNEGIEPSIYFKRLSMDLNFKILFNEDLPIIHGNNNNILKSGGESSVEKMAKLVELAVEQLNIGDLFDFIKITEGLYYKHLLKNDNIFKPFRNLVKERYDSHINTIDFNNPRDLLDLFITSYCIDDINNITDEDISKININKITNENIEDIVQMCVDVFFAGTETTSATLEWLIVSLINNPEHQEIAFKELKTVVINKKDHIITTSDRLNTPYIPAMIKESLRLHIPSLFGLPRSIGGQDITVGEYLLPRESIVFINFHGIAFDEKNYQNPKEYDPTRFLGQKSEAFFPFSTGFRTCPGQQIANDTIYLAISNIIINYKIRSYDGKKVDETQVFNLTTAPKKFKMILEPR